MLDINKLKLLADAAEKSKKLEELNVQIPNLSLLNQQLVESLAKIDFTNVIKSFQIKIPKIDFAQLLPKIDYSQIIPVLPQIDYAPLMKTLQISLPKIDFSSMAELYKSQFLSIQDIASSFAKMQTLDLAKIRANAFFMASSIDSIKNINALNSSFAVELASTIYKIMEESENSQEAINEFESLVEANLNEQSNSRAVLEVILFILTLISCLADSGQLYYAKLQYDEGKQSSQIVDQRYSEIIGVLNKIAKGIDKEPESDKTYYAVQRTLELKVNPTFKSPTIAVIYPNQQVTLKKSSHKWIYVEYFDYLDGIPKYGWANKKYLVRIEKSK